MLNSCNLPQYIFRFLLLSADVLSCLYNLCSPCFSVYITWMYLVVMYIVPFTCLAAFNLRIYLQIRVAIQWQGPAECECVE